MGKQTLLSYIKERLAGKCWRWFLKLNNITEDEYFRQIQQQQQVKVEPEVKVNFAGILEEKKNELRILLNRLPKNDKEDETIRKKQMLTYGLLIIRDIESKISA